MICKSEICKIFTITNIQEYIYLRLVNFYFRTCWILLIAFFIQQTLRQMSCSTQMIRNSDVISSKISHGTSKTAEWIVTQSENCNPTSTKVAIGRLWSEYEKLRKNKSKTDGAESLRNSWKQSLLHPHFQQQ